MYIYYSQPLLDIKSLNHPPFSRNTQSCWWPGIGEIVKRKGGNVFCNKQNKSWRDIFQADEIIRLPHWQNKYIYEHTEFENLYAMPHAVPSPRKKKKSSCLKAKHIMKHHKPFRALIIDGPMARFEVGAEIAIVPNEDVDSFSISKIVSEWVNIPLVVVDCNEKVETTLAEWDNSLIRAYRMALKQINISRDYDDLVILPPTVVIVANEDEPLFLDTSQSTFEIRNITPDVDLFYYGQMDLNTWMIRTHNTEDNKAVERSARITRLSLISYEARWNILQYLNRNIHTEIRKLFSSDSLSRIEKNNILNNFICYNTRLKNELNYTCYEEGDYIEFYNTLKRNIYEMKGTGNEVEIDSFVAINHNLITTYFSLLYRLRLFVLWSIREFFRAMGSNADFVKNTNNC